MTRGNFSHTNLQMKIFSAVKISIMLFQIIWQLKNTIIFQCFNKVLPKYMIYIHFIYQ